MPPTRDKLLQALSDPNSNPLAKAVARALSRYSEEFAATVQQNGGISKTIQLTAPRDKIEQAAFDLFVQELNASLPETKITIRESGGGIQEG
jgi:hypothetical protein